MAMAPTYFDYLLGKAGTGVRAYAMLEQIGALSPPGMAERQRVVDIIDAGFKAPWVGPSSIPGAKNGHPDADIFRNLSQGGFFHGSGSWLRGQPFDLQMILGPVLSPGETILESELSESRASNVHRFRSIVATSLRILTLTNQPDVPGPWVDPATDVSVNWLDWHAISSVIVQTAKETPPCGRITVLARAAGASSPTLPPEPLSSASMGVRPPDLHSNALHYYPAEAEAEVETPWSPRPPSAPPSTQEAVMEQEPPPFGAMPAPYAPPSAELDPYGPPPVERDLGQRQGVDEYLFNYSPFLRSDAEIERRLLKIGRRIEQLLAEHRDDPGSDRRGSDAGPEGVRYVLDDFACSRCSRQIPHEARFCGYCGQRLDQAGGVSGTAAQAAPETHSAASSEVHCRRCELEEWLSRCMNATMVPPQEAMDEYSSTQHEPACPNRDRTALW